MIVHHISHVDSDVLVHSEAKPSQDTSCDCLHICRVSLLHDVDSDSKKSTAVAVGQNC